LMSPGDWGRRTIRPAPTPERHHRLALHLADLYTYSVTPAPAASHATSSTRMARLELD